MPALMSTPPTTRAAFIDQVLTSSFPDQRAKRFAFPDGEVAALYTMGRDPTSGHPCPVVLYLATFPPSAAHAGFHDFGLDFREQPVASEAEAHRLLAQFEQAQAASFRAACRP